MRRFHFVLIALGAALCSCSDGGTTAGDPSQSPSGPVVVSPIDVPVAPLCPQALRTQFRARQGRSLLGTRAQGFSVREVRIGCAPVEGLTLDATTLRGSVGGKAVAGQDFVGATVVQTDDSGVTGEARIDAIEPDPQDPSGQTLLYTLNYKNAETGAPESACIPDKDGVAKAIPVRGTWDSTGTHLTDAASGFSFGCTSGVVAKCVRWGYRPWQNQGNTSLAPYHEACVRMARADYCGDGTSFTQDNTDVDIYDGIGLLSRTPSLLLFDGAWTTQGAYCIGKERWLSILGLLSPGCKAKFDSLALLETSPIDASDLCVVKRRDLARSSVLIDNRAGLNITVN